MIVINNIIKLVINKIIFFVGFFFLIAITSIEGFAQTQEEVLSSNDKLKSLQLQLDMLTTVQSVDELMVNIRDNIRPSDALQNVSEVPYSGWAMRESYKLMMELAKKMTMGPYTPLLDKLDNITKSTGLVRKITAFVDLTYKFGKTVEDAETSSGADKVRSLAEMIKSISKIIPSPGPVSLYIGEIAKAVNGIAENVEIIENATKEKNKVIDQTKIGRFADEVDEILKYKEGLDKIEKNPAIEALEMEIRLLKEKINEKDYAKIYEAKLKCYEVANINHKKFFDMGLKRDRLKFIIIRLEGLLESLSLKESRLKFEYSDTKIAIVNAESQRAQIQTPNNEFLNLTNKINRWKGELKRIENSQKRLQVNNPGIVAKLNNNIEEAKKEYSELNSKLGSFNECIKEYIRDQYFEQDNYIEENFPQYRSSISNDLKKKAIPSSNFNNLSGGWKIVGDAQGNSTEPIYTGGSIKAKDDAVGGVWYWKAPEAYLGNQSRLYGRKLSYRLKTNNIDTQFDHYDIVLKGAGKILTYDTELNPGINWTDYQVGIHESTGWMNKSTGQPVTQIELKEVLSDISELLIRGEFRTGDDTGWLDSVHFD